MNTAAPTWEDYWRSVGNETFRAARELAELSPRVCEVLSTYLRWDYDDGDEQADPDLRWNDLAEDVADVVNDPDNASGLEVAKVSTHEFRLLQMIASLTDRGYYFNLGDLAYLGSWERDALTILVEWASDGRLSVADQGRR